MNQIERFMVFVLLFCLTLLTACASGPATQVDSEREVLQTALVPGERVVLANSCSQVPTPSFFGGARARFGSCFLTNLRFIYEESEWFRALDIAAKFVPTGGDFGITTLLAGTAKALTANYVVSLGAGGQLGVAKLEGRLIIPLSEITVLELVEGFCIGGECQRWVTVTTRQDEEYHFEIYTYPPDQTGIMTAERYSTAHWKEAIANARTAAFGPLPQ